MAHWKTASRDDKKRLTAISMILKNCPGLVDQIFDPNEPNLRTSPQALLRGRSSGEKVLIGIALDLWNESVGVRVLELDALDLDNLQSVFSALNHLRLTEHLAQGE